MPVSDNTRARLDSTRAAIRSIINTWKDANLCLQPVSLLVEARDELIRLGADKWQGRPAYGSTFLKELEHAIAYRSSHRPVQGDYSPRACGYSAALASVLPSEQLGNFFGRAA